MSNGENGNTGKMEDTIFVDKSKEFENVPESVGESSKTLPSTEKEENKRNEEVEENKRNEIKRKRGRPSERDKEGLPESKKVKESPRKKKNLMIMSINNNGKSNGYSKLLKKKAQKCVSSVKKSTYEKPSGRVWVRRNLK